MRIRFRQQYQWLEEYPFSYTFEKWLAAELKKRIQPSASFIKKYGKDWRVSFCICSSAAFSGLKIWKPDVQRQRKEIDWNFSIPFFGYGSLEPAFYSRAVRVSIETIASMLRRFEIDPSRLLHDLPELIRQFESDPTMVNARAVKKIVRQFQEANAPAPEQDNEIPARRRPARRLKLSKAAMPKWKIPNSLNKTIADEGSWEDERFDPILLTVMSDSEYRGRKIPLAWQIEFEPDDERLEFANSKLEASGVEPDGDGWSEVVTKQFARKHPKLAGELHSDSESTTCVLWVESEHACQFLMELVWSLIYPK